MESETGAARDPQGAGPPGLRAPLAAAIIAGAATIAFLLPWWNRHLGLSLDGYMPLYGWKILAGEIPYRDFYLHLPPLQPLLEAAIQALAGRSLLAFRLVGAVGRVALAAITAAWLARRFRPGTAALASFAAVCVASSDDTEILDLYNHHSLVGAIASGWLASIALDRGQWQRWAWIGSGAAAAAAFWTKQTVGVGAAVAVPLALLVLLLRNRRDRGTLLRGGAGFGIGWAAFSLPIAVWLLAHGAFSAFIDQVFRGAAASKGPATELLLRPWVDPFHIPDVTRSAAAGLIVAALVVIALRTGPAARVGGPGQLVAPRQLAVKSGALIAAIAVLFLVPFVSPASNPTRTAHQLLDLLRVGVFAGLFATLFLAFQLVLRALRRPLDQAEAELLLLFGVAESAAAMHALSYPAGGTAALPCLAVALAVALDAPARARRLAPIRYLALTALLVATVAAAGIRTVRPFSFVQWREPPPIEATERSKLPELAGMRLSSGTAGVTDDLTRVILDATRQGDPLFTFPVYPIFNWLADRPVPTFAILHWIDVTPDRVVATDLERVLADPPPAIVFQWTTDRLLTLNELYFRGGRESAMRAMQYAIAELVERDYVLAFYQRVPHYHSAPALQLWIRRDRAETAGIAPLDPAEQERKR